MSITPIKSALISVFYKDGIDTIAKQLHQQGVTIYSTGGTEKFLLDHGIPVEKVEDMTGFPSIFGGRVKTLHPKIFGGILHRRNLQSDLDEAKQYQIPSIDLVIVDLYPFTETVNNGGTEEEIIEKIDIGGVSLIRAAAKNFGDTTIISNQGQYAQFSEIYEAKKGTELSDRKRFAYEAFKTTAEYDTAISDFFADDTAKFPLRYGENPHQPAYFKGNLNEVFTQLNGKAISYNNLLDLEAGLQLIDEFTEPTFAVIKHNNACGVASRPTALQAWEDALSCDPVSAFGGVLVGNQKITLDIATKMADIFFEILIAPEYDQEALDLLSTKKNRILLERKPFDKPQLHTRTVLNGVLVQQPDLHTDSVADFNEVTKKKLTKEQQDDLIFASKICKHTKSNTIILAKDKKLLGSGTGQTSRVDALLHAIDKAKNFEFSLTEAVMASDAFFPFPDCVEIAHKQGVNAVIHPGGSIRDKDSIDFCDEHDMAMVTTGFRHFKH